MTQALITLRPDLQCAIGDGRVTVESYRDMAGRQIIAVSYNGASAEYAVCQLESKVWKEYFEFEIYNAKLAYKLLCEHIGLESVKSETPKQA